MIEASAVPLSRTVGLGLLVALIGLGCAQQNENPLLEGQDIRVTFLHTSDIHSRLLPYDMTVLASDRGLGLLPENAPFGGIARIAHILNRERATIDRTLYVDSGDCFQGAPIFNVFHGEIEQLAMSYLRPDTVVIGNHEFDEGLGNYVKQLKNNATYPVVAANYLYAPGNPLAELSRPYTIRNVGGLRVAIIGIANFSSISSITDVGNSLGILPLQNITVLQEYIDFLSPNADLIVGVSHAGLTEDEEIIAGTTGFDLVFGGHLHVALNPPKVVLDKAGREVPLVHSGAFAKYVGRLDVIVRDGEVKSHKYTLFPVDSRVPEDAAMLELLEPYKLELQRQIDLSSVFGFASKVIARFGTTGGDAPLGNLVAEAVRFQARADFGLTNTLGIRANISQGPITLDSIFNVFPFNNTVTKLFVSGIDLQAMLDFVTTRSAGRGCATQVQIAGLRFTMNCNPSTPECPDCPRAEDVALTDCSSPDNASPEDCVIEPIVPTAIYSMATNDYIAGGGSGFTILKNNNTQYDTGLPLRDAVLEHFVRGPKCQEECRNPQGQIKIEECGTFQACLEQVTAFQDRFCRKLADTDLDEEVSRYCGHDDQRCEVPEDCYKKDEVCADGNCEACEKATDCDPANCEGDVCGCIEKRCVSSRMGCVNGRCALGCTEDADCPNFLVTNEELHLCVQGGCVPRPATACLIDGDCNPATRFCFGDTQSCSIDDDCPDGQGCEQRHCIPKRTRCATSDECAGGAVCRFGWCGFPEPCTGGGDCVGNCVLGNCQSTCSACSENSHCAEGQECVDGLCIPLVARCVENRCRAACLGQKGGVSDCPAASTCIDKLCRPDACVKPRDAETLCHIKNESLNAQRCLSLPCPRAQSDGRIKTILPENLDDLPKDQQPDDPE